MTDIRAIVFEEIENAVANGTHWVDWKPWEMAIDLNRLCAPLDHIQAEELLPFVLEWRRSKELPC